MRKKILAFIGLIIIGALTYGITANYPKLGIVTAYAAKKMCSCTFIAERDQESIQNQDLANSPLNLTETVIDRDNKRVTSSLFGLASKTAEFRGKLGCVLIQGKDDYNITFPEMESPESDSVEVSYPFGDRFEMPKMEGVDYDRLSKVADYAFDPGNEITTKKTRSLLVIYKDTVILERYANGYDEETEILGWSMTKSLMNTWIGMLVKEGKVNIAEKSLFPEWKDDERKEISLNDLLHMASGLEWDEVYSSISTATTMLYKSEDNGAVALKQPKEFEPGTYWEYSSGTSNLISKFIRNQYEDHDDYLRFPHERIFQPLNMKSAVMEVDESGSYIGSSYCYATTRDWGRFGTLFLHDGVFNGERLLPEGWVEYSRTPVEDSNGRYGAHFWTNAPPKYYKDAPEDMFSANGFEGQRVFIIPSKDLVIVRMGLNSSFNFNGLVKNIVDSIE